MSPSERKSMPPLAVGNRHHQAEDDLNLDEVPARVANIHFDGLTRTKEDVLKKMTKDLLTASNFQDMVLKAHEVKERLNNLHAYNGIGIVVDASNKNKNKDGNNNHKYQQKSKVTINDCNYDITFHVIEKKRVTGSINTTFGAQNSGSINTGINLPNILGRGESATFNYVYGNKCSAGFDVLINKPLAPWTPYNPNFILTAFQKGFANPWNGLSELNRGSYFGVQSRLTNDVSASVFINSIITSLSATNAETPLEARLNSGHYLKGSVSTNITYDTRNSSSLPSSGNLIKLSSELSGLTKFGNVHFIKNELELQTNISFFNSNLIFQSTLKHGLINDLSNDVKKLIITDNSRVPINERFNIGGPLSLRGYSIHGVGPHDSYAALGGNAYWVYGAHVYTPLPWGGSIKDIVRAHLFFNAGSLESINFHDANSSLIQSLRANIRKSVGAGIVVAFGVVRLELNYSYPILGANGAGQDRIDEGVQFGIGATFT